MAPPSGQLRAGRYLLALAVITLLLYAAVFFTGTSRTPKLGLDLQGGTTVTLQAVSQNNKAPRKDQLLEARSIIERRVNGLGVAEAEVVTQGSNQIVISIPGQKGEAAKRIAGTAQLRFRQVVASAAGTAAPPPSAAPSAAPSAGPSVIPSRGPTPAPVRSAATPAPAPTASSQKRAVTSALVSPSPSASPGASSGASSSPSRAPSAGPTAAPSVAPSAAPQPTASPLPAGSKLGALLAKQPAESLFGNANITCAVLKQRPPGATDDPKKKQVACDDSGQAKYLLDAAKVLGTDVGSADYQVDNTSGGNWKVILNFTNKGQSRWTNLTRQAFGKTSPNDQVAIVLDGVVVSAPQIRGVIAGQAEITGQFTQTEAQLLSNQLKYGALPLTFSTSTAQTISPTLGTDQLKAGLLAGGIGLLLVVLYSLLYYRLLGLVTIFSLVLSGLITYACVVLLGRQIGFTLTLAGIAGFIVAVGITADSFVVFFERLKDEVKDGRTVRSAVPRAWVRARQTILSADAVSFLAALSLYVFTVGAVRGFAFTLGLSTLLDLLIVFFFTHPVVSLAARSRAFASPRITGLGNVRHHEPTFAGAPAASRPGRLGTAKESS